MLLFMPTNSQMKADKTKKGVGTILLYPKIRLLALPTVWIKQ